MRWQIFPLREVAEINPRRPNVLGLSDDSPVTFVPMPAVSEVTASIEMPEIRAYAEVKKGFTYFGNDDVLFAKITPCMENGKSAIASDLHNGIGFGSTEFHVIRVNKQILLPKFFHYFIRQQSFRNLAKARMRGAVGQQRVPKDFLDDVKVPLPLLSEQRRIVEILDQADALRKKRAEADAKAARILPALFYKMFGDPATNPKGSPLVAIGELVEAVKRRDPSVQPGEPFTYIDIAGVDGHLGLIADAKTLMGAEAPSRARQIIRTNDVIISTVRPYLRATALVPSQYDNQICSTGFCVLRAKAGIGFGFLYALSRLQWLTDQLNARARGASYPAVTDSDVFSLRVPRSDDRDEIKSFDRQVLDVLALQDYRRGVVAKIETLFEALLHRAFTGDLTAKWREAHMKELLQEMEQQAKALETTKHTNDTKGKIE